MSKKVGLTLDRLFYQTLARKKNEMIIEGQKEITYFQLFENAVKLGNNLADMGFSGKRIAVLDWNSIDYASLMYGIPFAGASIHPVNLRLPPDQIIKTMKFAKDEAVFYSRDFAQLASTIIEMGILKKDKTFGMGEGTTSDITIEEITKGGKGELGGRLDEEREMSILFTSGTTGDPKAVTYSHRDAVLAIWSILTSLSAYEGMSRLNSKDIVFPQIPFYHIWSWGSLFTSTMLGNRYILGGKFDPKEAMNTIEKQGVTWMNMVPTMLYALLSSDKGAILSGKKVLIGGSPIPAGLVEKARKIGVELTSIYGFTDGLIASVGTLHESYRNLAEEEKYAISTKFSTPSPLSEIKIVQIKDAPPEIRFRSPWLPDCYYGDNTRSKESFEDGWFKPGDSGRLDELGNLAIEDRMKDLIKSGGEFISSSILESYMSEIPGVEMVAVVPKGDEKWVERPFAFIKTGIDFDKQVKAIKDRLGKLAEQGKLSKWWVPDEFRQINDMPLTGTGKIDKKELRKLAGGN